MVERLLLLAEGDVKTERMTGETGYINFSHLVDVQFQVSYTLNGCSFFKNIFGFCFEE